VLSPCDGGITGAQELFGQVQRVGYLYVLLHKNVRRPSKTALVIDRRDHAFNDWQSIEDGRAETMGVKNVTTPPPSPYRLKNSGNTIPALYIFWAFSHEMRQCFGSISSCDSHHFGCIQFISGTWKRIIITRSDPLHPRVIIKFSDVERSDCWDGAGPRSCRDEAAASGASRTSSPRTRCRSRRAAAAVEVSRRAGGVGVLRHSRRSVSYKKSHLRQFWIK